MNRVGVSSALYSNKSEKGRTRDTVGRVVNEGLLRKCTVCDAKSAPVSKGEAGFVVSLPEEDRDPSHQAQGRPCADPAHSTEGSFPCSREATEHQARSSHPAFPSD